jgi:hypothetical protein
MGNKRYALRQFRSSPVYALTAVARAASNQPVIALRAE